MTKSLLELTAEIVRENIEGTAMTLDEIEKLLLRVFNALTTIQQAEDRGGLIQALSDAVGKSTALSEWQQGQAAPPMDPRDSIQEDWVICLECGAHFRQLTANHLRTHQLNHREYKEKWGFRQKDSLSARSVGANRSIKAKQRGLPKALQAYQEKRRRENRP